MVRGPEFGLRASRGVSRWVWFAGPLFAACALCHLLSVWRKQALGPKAAPSLAEELGQLVALMDRIWHH